MKGILFLEDTTFIHSNMGDLGSFLFGAIIYSAAVKIFLHGFSEQYLEIWKFYM